MARLSLTAGAHVRYELKTPYTDSTTHVLFEPLDASTACSLRTAPTERR